MNERAALKKGQNAFFQVVIKITKIFFLSNGIFYTDQPCGKFYFSNCFLYSLNFSIIKSDDYFLVFWPFCVFSVFLAILATQRGFCFCFASPSTHGNSDIHGPQGNEGLLATASQDKRLEKTLSRSNSKKRR